MQPEQIGAVSVHRTLAKVGMTPGWLHPVHPMRVVPRDLDQRLSIVVIGTAVPDVTDLDESSSPRTASVRVVAIWMSSRRVSISATMRWKIASWAILRA